MNNKTQYNPFPDMVALVPKGSYGTARVEHYDVGKQDSGFHNLRQAFSGGGLGSMGMIDPGRYCRLMVDGALVMSDTGMERSTNLEAYRLAHGDVLIAGLGLGMIVHAIVAKKEVARITVVEKSEDVIALVKPTLPTAINVIHADIFKYKPDRKFDTIYFDIWADICTDNLPEIAKLHQRAKCWLRRGNGAQPAMLSWMQDILRDRRHEERRMERSWL